ncbi:MAG: nitroreductase family protein [Dehalococcoidia bacterium]|jgi:nitroreductase/NAD-dependent dihydropyrimidine dehydrogenase PreA subunit
MEIFSIDRDKCDLCGLCAADCPGFVVAMSGDDGFPSPAPGGEERCIKCGHCVAICPNGAFNHRLMNAEQCPEIDRVLLPSSQSIEHFLKSRRSIRTYKEESLDRKTLEKLLDIASYAPSGHNSQPVSWIVISGREELKSLGDKVAEWMRLAAKDKPELDSTMKLGMVADAWAVGVDIIMRGAPHLVVAHAPRQYGPLGYEGCLIALSYLELAAYSLGAGACWAGYVEMAAVNYQPLRQALNIPEVNRPYGVMMLGRPEYKYSRIPLRKDPDIQWK